MIIEETPVMFTPSNKNYSTYKFIQDSYENVSKYLKMRASSIFQIQTPSLSIAPYKFDTKMGKYIWYCVSSVIPTFLLCVQ